MSVFVRIVVFLVFLLPITASAANDDWRVSKATLQVKYTTDRTNWIDLRTGDVVPNRAWISTGPRGRLQLVRGVESIVFQPNTMASITTTNGLLSSRKTEVVQRIGALDLKIEKRSQPHTSVQTPYLAAVVKGTVFRVTVTKTKASIVVNRGLVQVTSFASGQRSDIGAGQSASVDRNTGMRVTGQLSNPSVDSVTPSVARLPAIGTTTLSGQEETRAASDGESSSSRRASNANNHDGGKTNSDVEKGSSSDRGNGSNGNGNTGRGENANSGKENSNAGGNNGNGNATGNENGNSGNGNGNTGGNQNGNNGNGNNNAGGNQNENSGSGNNNAGGNQNGNSGNGNNNAGGNQNENSGSGNNNAGGNQNGNSGSGNSNAGGNQNENSGSGNSNAGGNQNENSGSGNNNAGGNQNGNTGTGNNNAGGSICGCSGIRL